MKDLDGVLFVLVGCEESQRVAIELRAMGLQAYSCDLRECSGGHPEWHIVGDVLGVMNGGTFKTQAGNTVVIKRWDAGIFFPDCTFITCSAEWAYKEPDFERYPGVGYHQKLKPGTLVGAARCAARVRAILFVKQLYNSSIPNVAIENPVGKLSSAFQRPTQIIQPYYFGEDASKATCLWLKGFPVLKNVKFVEPRMVCCNCGAHNDYYDSSKGCGSCGSEASALRPRWGNQTDSGQNKVSPSDNRAMERSKTYKGVAKAMAEQWFNYKI